MNGKYAIYSRLYELICSACLTRIIVVGVLNYDPSILKCAKIMMYSHAISWLLYGQHISGHKIWLFTCSNMKNLIIPFLCLIHANNIVSIQRLPNFDSVITYLSYPLIYRHLQSCLVLGTWRATECQFLFFAICIDYTSKKLRSSVILDLVTYNTTSFYRAFKQSLKKYAQRILVGVVSIAGRSCILYF